MQTRPPYIAPPPVKPPKMYSQNTVNTLVALLCLAVGIIIVIWIVHPTIWLEIINWFGAFLNDYFHGR